MSGAFYLDVSNRDSECYFKYTPSIYTKNGGGTDNLKIEEGADTETAETE